MFKKEHLYSVALRASSFVGDVNFMKLIRFFGSAEEAWKCGRASAGKILGIAPKILNSIGSSHNLRRAEQELEFCEAHNINILLRHQNQLPPLLAECHDAPAVLYQKGAYEKQFTPISIVGTRNMTPYGKSFIIALMEALQSQKITVVSGLALGTDGCAHSEALKRGIPTIAVLAHGLQTIYPPQHQKLSSEIIFAQGALLSEFQAGVLPERENFLRRNRIIAGISPLTLVVETAFGGGSMSTVTYANDYNREVFALPGKITDPYSQGCNLMIAQHKAKIVHHVSDIIEELGINKSQINIGMLFENPSVRLSGLQQKVYEAIAESERISIDDLVDRLGISSSQLLPILLALELQSIIKPLSGGQFSLK